MKLYSREQMLKKYPNKNVSSEEFWLVTSDGQSIGTNNLDEFNGFFSKNKGMFYVDGPDRYARYSSLKEAVYAAIEGSWAYGEVRYVRGTPEGGLFSLDECPVIFEADN